MSRQSCANLKQGSSGDNCKANTEQEGRLFPVLEVYEVKDKGIENVVSLRRRL
jgi:hypothetical protein